MLNQIKSSEKIITFSNFDDNNLITYSWIIDGAKIDSETDLNTAISFDSKYKKIMLKLSNYADGLYISNNSKTLKYTTIKLYVGNKFDNDDLVNIYKYTKGNKKLELVKSDIKVEDGYIEIDSEGLKDYLITKSTITSIDNCQNDNEQSSLNVVEIIVTIIITLIILLGIVFIIMKKHHIKISDLKNILKNSNNI
jgi:hypothetical protein